MADVAQLALEKSIPELHGVRAHNLITDDELRDIVKRRRDHEYNIVRVGATRDDYLKYASFEREFSDELYERAKNLSLDHNVISKFVKPSAHRVDLIYRRAVKRFKGDEELWLHFARHCSRKGYKRGACRVFNDAIAMRGDSERIWLAAIAFHFDSCEDPTNARSLAQRGLRTLPNSRTMWREYFRLEVINLATLIARRLSVGAALHGDNDGRVPKNASSFKIPLDIKDTSEADKSKTAKLTFWNGGIPIAVFRAASKAGALVAEDIVEWCSIVMRAPALPPKFLEAFSRELKTMFPNSPICEALAVSCPCLVVCANYRRLPPEDVEDENTLSRPQSARVQAERTRLKQTIRPTFHSAVSRLRNTFEKGLRELDQHEQMKTAFSVFLEAFGNALVAGEKDDHSKLKPLQNFVSTYTIEKKKQLTDADSRDDPSAWSLNKLEAVLAENNSELLLEDNIRAALEEKLLVAFRDLDQENLLCLWLAREPDVDELRKTCNTLLSLPPITMKSLIAAIDRELELWAERKKVLSDKTAVDKQMVHQVRKLFLKAIALPGAKKEVELWLRYMDFERRVARDSKQVSTINWKALKVLGNRDKELFLERQTLRNLAT